MVRSPRIQLHTDLWPIVRCILQGELTDADYEELFQSFERLWQRREQFFLIIDIRQSANSTPRRRQLIGDWMKENRALIQRYSLGSAVIVDSAILRGALTAINWIAQPETPSDYVRNWEEAAKKALLALEKHQLLTDALRAQVQGRGLNPHSS